MRLLFFSMWPFTLSAIRSGFRSRAIQSVLIIGALLVGVAYLAALFSPRHPKTVALDVGFSGIRFTLVLFSLYWVQELVGREIERRTVAFQLAYPLPRSHYLCGRYLGILVLLGVATLFLGLLLWTAVLFAGHADYEQVNAVALGVPFWAAVAGYAIDAAVVAAFALLISTLSTVPMLPVALGIAFAVGGKALGSVLEYVGKGADGQTELVARFGPLLDVIRWLLPDLSRLDWRTWSMYRIPLPDGMIFYGVLANLAYAVLLLALAVIAFSRREFT